MKSLLAAILMLSSSARADLASGQRQFAEQERDAIECQYALARAEINALIPRGVSKRDKEIFNLVRQPLFVADCSTYPNQVFKPDTLREAKAGPLYTELPENISGFACAMKREKDFEQCESAKEAFLRPLFVAKRACPGVGNSTALLRDEAFWHNYLIQNGYECVVKEFRRLALLVPGSQSFQNSLDRISWKRATRNGTKTLAGLHIAYLPQAVYERSYLRDTPPISFFYPKEGERLSAVRFKSGLEALGADVKIIHRVSTEDLDVQVQQSLELLKKYDAATAATGGFIAVARSSGAAVMTIILKQHAHELPNLKLVLNVGGVPRGSVIAEYKSRWDNFFNGIVQKIIPLVPVIHLVDFMDNFDPRLIDNIVKMLISAFSPEKLASLSFKNPLMRYSPDESRVTVPVVNYMFLNRTEERRLPSTDPVFQTMLMYGPTEGSSRLVDSAFESARHVRVFDDRYGHLAFRGLDQIEAIETYLVLLQAAREQGFIR